MNKIKEFFAKIHNNKIVDFILRNGYAIALTVLGISLLSEPFILVYLIIIGTVTSVIGLQVNLLLYIISNFRFSRDAMKDITDGDGNISIMQQIASSIVIGCTIIACAILDGLIMWIVFSDILTKSV